MDHQQPAAVRIDTDGTVTALNANHYEVIRDGVGGWIEAAPTDGSITLWINEEGKIDGLPFNPLGHALWNEVDTYGCIARGDYLVGPCVVTGPPDDDGDNTPVPEWLLPRLARLATSFIVIEMPVRSDR